ncbi:hypothetical protein Tco_0535366 [Tanacetum coccineum]
MTRYPRRWTKCSKESGPLLGEDRRRGRREEEEDEDREIVSGLMGQQKWSVLLKGTKGIFIRYGLEVPKNLEIEAAQEKYKETWGYTLLIPEKILSPLLSRLRKRFWPWKLKGNIRGYEVAIGVLEKFGPSGERYPPNQSKERKPRKE